MKTIGRIMLLVVGIILIAMGIPSIIKNVNLLNAAGWDQFWADPVKMNYFLIFITSSANVLFGLDAVIVCLRGRGSFWLFIYTLIMIGGVIWYFVRAFKAGTLGDWKEILRTIFGFALPICYFLGSLFIRAE